MGRKTATGTTGIYRSDEGYDVDRQYRKKRLRKCGFADFESAKAWLIAQMDLVRAESLTTPDSIRTFSQVATHYLNEFKDKPSIKSDVYHLQALMPFIGDMRIDQIHDQSLKPFITARKAQMRKVRVSKDNTIERSIKNKTINLSLEKVRRILNLCARSWRDEDGKPWLQTAPLITMLPKTDARPPRPIMWEEQRKLLPLLPDHLAEMALFVLNTGVRDDVVVSLQWEWEVPVAQLGVSIFIVPKEHVKAEEGHKREMVLVCNNLAQKIINRQRGKHKTHVFVYRRELGKHSKEKKERPYRPIETMNNTAWQNARLKAGLGDLHVHDLRHTVGMRLREAGVSEATISSVLWHSNKSITAHYSMAQVVEIFEALELIKDESKRWNMSLQSLIMEAKTQRAKPKLANNLP